jgi:aminopeptidase-like protein
MNNNALAQEIYDFCGQLFPINRSITGQGVRATLDIIQSIIPPLQRHEVPSGTQAFDWIIPKEWNIKDAYIIDPQGNKILDFKNSNLHVVGYSTPVDVILPLDELQEHLYSLPNQEDAIPYITSYYKERWGFCLSHKQRQSLQPGNYHVKIDSTLQNGSLSYGELLLPGEMKSEIFISTYICHPSMANNEISGPAVTTYIAKWLLSLPKRYYSYRIIFIPETIGSIVYLSKHLHYLQKNVVAGFNITCIGDERNTSYLASRYGDTLADRVAQHTLKYLHPDYVNYTYLERGSDERQYCSPGVDLPVVCIMRSKYGEYPEYHTSLDDMNFISPAGLYGGYEILQKCIQILERNRTYQVTQYCEPQLGRRGLYPTLSTLQSRQIVRNMMNLLAYCDGHNDFLEIAEIIGVPAWDLFEILDRLIENYLIKDVHHLFRIPQRKRSKVQKP